MTTAGAGGFVSWAERAAKLTFQTGLYIDGAYVAAADGATLPVVNPATGKVVCQLACGGAADIERAVTSARAAWDDGRWRRMAPRARMAVFARFAQIVEDQAEDLALLETLSMGKPITDALTIDLPETVVTIRYFGECIDKVAGQVTQTVHEATHMVIREPLGVVGAISAWNYPLLMAAWKIAPALAAGNAVVLKPSERAALSPLKLAELFVEAGGPPGVFNVVNGLGAVAGEALALHEGVDKISFTGSTATGKRLMISAGRSNLKRVSLETGGKSPQIFMPDLPDFDVAVETAVRGIFDNAGQVCNAGSRLLVHEDLKDRFVEAFEQKAKALYVSGDPLDPATSLGPLSSHAHRDQALGWVRRGVEEGARLAFGGEEHSGQPDGAYLTPTLFVDVTPDMAVAREEIFGPVAVLLTFGTEEEAIAFANDTIYGLAASVWTSDVKRAHRMIKALQAGVVWINCFGDGDMTQPFGGYKQSGNTRDKSMACMEGYMQSKSAWFNLA